MIYDIGSFRDGLVRTSKPGATSRRVHVAAHHADHAADAARQST